MGAVEKVVAVEAVAAGATDIFSIDNFNIALKSPTFVSRIELPSVTPAFRTSRTAGTRPSGR